MSIGVSEKASKQIALCFVPSLKEEIDRSCWEKRVKRERNGDVPSHHFPARANFGRRFQPLRLRVTAKNCHTQVYLTYLTIYVCVF